MRVYTWYMCEKRRGESYTYYRNIPIQHITTYKPLTSLHSSAAQAVSQDWALKAALLFQALAILRLLQEVRALALVKVLIMFFTLLMFHRSKPVPVKEDAA